CAPLRRERALGATRDYAQPGIRDRPRARARLARARQARRCRRARLPGRAPAVPLRPQPGGSRPRRRRGRIRAPGGGMANQVLIPAMPNAHSHAFQRGLRGRGERAPDDFWSWRDAMYALAEALDLDDFERVSRETYEQMAAAGYGAVGEFHYVHHAPDGAPYDDPNAMAKALARAARAAGLLITLLP